VVFPVSRIGKDNTRRDVEEHRADQQAKRLLEHDNQRVRI
jgi:hypothetical protein